MSFVCAVVFGAALLWLWREKRRSDLNLRGLFDGVPIAIHEIDRAGVIRRANRGECDLLGYAPGELIGRPVWELLAPEHQAVAREAIFGKFAETEPLSTFEREYVRRDGARLTVRIQESAIRDRRGRVVRLRSALLDMTQCRLAERALRESEEIYRRLFEGVGAGIYRTAPDGRVLMANPALVAMLGYSSPAELQGLTLEGSSEPSFERAAFLVRVAQQGEVRGREAELARRDGSRLTVIENARAIRGEDSRILYYEGTLQDITERTRAAERLRASEERYRRLFEDAHDVILTYDLQGRLTSLNKAGERVLGASRAEAIGSDLSEFLCPDEVAMLRSRIAGLLAGAPYGPREMTVKSRDGRPAVLEVNSRLVFEHGRPVGISAIAHDITERKQWEEELQRKNTELASALVAAREGTEAKSRFLANMSHEIRTPMNGVVGIIELLLRTPLNAEQREYAEAVKRSAGALLQLINDILDFSRIEAGKLEVRPVVFSPARLAAEVRALLRPQADAKGIELRVAAAPELPRNVRADESRVRQVLVNLAGNAVKFTEHGWVELRIAVQQNALRFEVEDTGAGIAPGQSGNLFESFSQADTSLTRRHDGSGLGLAISKQLVGLMGGEIGYRSQPGAGSTFWFAIPVDVLAGDAEPVAAGLRALARTAKTEIRPARVLLAEDNELNRRIALRMLSAVGWHADSVANGRLAVQAVISGNYDAVLMDVHMPEMDGLSATAEIRRLEPGGRHTPIIAMTARAMAGDREKCLDAGMDDYLSKPVQLDALRAVVGRWVTSGPATLAPQSQ